MNRDGKLRVHQEAGARLSRVMGKGKGETWAPAALFISHIVLLSRSPTLLRTRHPRALCPARPPNSSPVSPLSATAVNSLRQAGSRGRSSVGRAPPLHGGGQGFESPRLHSEMYRFAGETSGIGRGHGACPGPRTATDTAARLPRCGLCCSARCAPGEGAAGEDHGRAARRGTRGSV